MNDTFIYSEFKKCSFADMDITSYISALKYGEMLRQRKQLENSQFFHVKFYIPTLLTGEGLMIESFPN